MGEAPPGAWPSHYADSLAQKEFVHAETLLILDPLVAIAKITDETTRQFHADIAALGVLPPTVEPRATQSIPEMRALIEALVVTVAHDRQVTLGEAELLRVVCASLHCPLPPLVADVAA